MKIGINRNDSKAVWALRVLLPVQSILLGWKTVVVAHDPRFHGDPWIFWLAFMIAARFFWAQSSPAKWDEKYDF